MTIEKKIDLKINIKQNTMLDKVGLTPPRVDNPTVYLKSLPVKTQLEKSIQLLEKYETCAKVARNERNQAISKLSQMGFTYREIAEMVGVSAPRIKQYIKIYNAEKNENADKT